jgi:hypothetical protein
MRDYLSTLLRCDKFSKEEKAYFRSLPPIYIADSVDDFNNYRARRYRVPIEGKSNPKHRDISYLTIILTDVTLLTASQNDNHFVMLTNEYGEQSYLFVLRQNKIIEHATNHTTVLWPLVTTASVEKQRSLDKYLQEPADLKGIFLCYDQKYDNACVIGTVEKGMKTIDDIMKEIWPTLK